MVVQPTFNFAAIRRRPQPRAFRRSLSRITILIFSSRHDMRFFTSQFFVLSGVALFFCSKGKRGNRPWGFFGGGAVRSAGAKWVGDGEGSFRKEPPSGG